MKKLTLLCSLIVLTHIAFAQTIDKKWSIGLHGGATQYKGDLGNDFYKFDMAFRFQSRYQPYRYKRKDRF